MGYWKHKMEEKNDDFFEGYEETVATLGGFIDVKVYGNTICMVSIPIPNLMADRYRDSVSKWVEYFEDFDGNDYKATVLSSKNGVNWKINIEPKEDDSLHPDDIIKEIASHIEITVNYTDEV